VVFPALALTGLVGVRGLGTRRQDQGAFLASSLYLAGMLASVAFGVVPNVLPSNTTPELSLTIDNAAAAAHGLVIGLWWFISGLALVIAYAVLTYQHVAGKVE
jgi:cytochrome bd ubiquinol oxidase subunit II